MADRGDRPEPQDRRPAEHAADPGGAPPADAVRRRLALACTMAGQVGRDVAGRFRGTLEMHIKESDSAVTDADRAAEARLRRGIARQFPDDSVLGEEQGLDARDPDWCWTLDPIDGTHNFLAGIPFFAVAIGVVHRGCPIAAVIHEPCRDETYTAARGNGAWRNGTPIRVAPGPLGPLSIVAVRHRFLRPPRAALFDRIPTRKFRSLGSICLEIAHAAEGGIAAIIAGSVRLWEVVPGGLLIEEAGGVVRDPQGRPLMPLAAPVAELADSRYQLLGGHPEIVEGLVLALADIPMPGGGVPGAPADAAIPMPPSDEATP
ncbi:MAG: inositol monophosphatase [Candidatus Eiseniibacteriota bacterium]